MQMITTLHKIIENEQRVICGHFTKEEIVTFKQQGWRKEPPQTNKNGIPVEQKKNFVQQGR